MSNTGKKCPICNGCLNIVWIGNRRLFLCDFCRKYFDIINLKMTEVEKPDA